MIDIDFFRTKWIPALRSGRYKQTESHLGKYVKDVREAQYCCIGVACRLHPNALFRTKFNFDYEVGDKRIHLAKRAWLDAVMPYTLGHDIGLIDGSYLSLPDSFKNTSAVQIKSGSEELIVGIERILYCGDNVPCISLVSLNDERLYSFRQIADVLEFTCEAWEQDQALAAKSTEKEAMAA